MFISNPNNDSEEDVQDFVNKVNLKAITSSYYIFTNNHKLNYRYFYRYDNLWIATNDQQRQHALSIVKKMEQEKQACATLSFVEKMKQKKERNAFIKVLQCM